MTEALVRNLKWFNAKERDHLMRFAYLGVNVGYAADTRFLSDAFDAELRTHLPTGFDQSAACVFAGMDYHLDWLFAALWLARTQPNWRPGQDELRVPMAPHAGVDGLKALYTDFRPLNGSQEDVDLVAVYDDGTKLAMMLIEAKGSAAFDPVQLARKLIRLDRILTETGTLAAPRLIEFRLILAAPTVPPFTDCLEFARDLRAKPGAADKFRTMRDALEPHPSGIGKGLHFLRLAGFPEDTYAVKRLPEKDVFTHWTLRKRA